VRLSVIVVAYNCRALLRGCLESLELASDELELELIVVDNASSDGTAAMVRERFPGVKLIASEENIGFARANNLALASSSGERLLFLNPDTVVPRGSLARALAALEARPAVGMLGVKLVKPDGTLDHAAKRGFPTPLSSLYHFVGLTRLAPRSPRFAQYTSGHVDPGETAPVDAVNGAFMLVRREALEDVGPMDEEFWLYMEDLDWCYRFWQAGWQVLYWPGASIVHLKGGSSPSGRSWRANHAFHRGMWLFYRKHYMAERPPLVTAAVFLGIWTKLLVSAGRGAALRASRRARSRLSARVAAAR
jgi:GT2 family glycosyltransferase